jgi:hypothetical protein
MTGSQRRPSRSYRSETGTRGKLAPSSQCPSLPHPWHPRSHRRPPRQPSLPHPWHPRSHRRSPPRQRRANLPIHPLLQPRSRLRPRWRSRRHTSQRHSQNRPRRTSRQARLPLRCSRTPHRPCRAEQGPQTIHMREDSWKDSWRLRIPTPRKRLTAAGTSAGSSRCRRSPALRGRPLSQTCRQAFTRALLRFAVRVAPPGAKRLRYPGVDSWGRTCSTFAYCI